MATVSLADLTLKSMVSNSQFLHEGEVGQGLQELEEAELRRKEKGNINKPTSPLTATDVLLLRRFLQLQDDLLKVLIVSEPTLRVLKAGFLAYNYYCLFCMEAWNRSREPLPTLIFLFT